MPPRGSAALEGELLQGTLDLLVLKTLVLGSAHGHTIAHAIQQRSDDVLQVEYGSLYPALHRLEDRGWIASFWGTSENNRRPHPGGPACSSRCSSHCSPLSFWPASSSGPWRFGASASSEATTITYITSTLMSG